MAVVDTKRGYVGMCNRGLVQQESGAANVQCGFLVKAVSGIYIYAIRGYVIMWIRIQICHNTRNNYYFTQHIQ